jgi:hypothetical protein
MKVQQSIPTCTTAPVHALERAAEMGDCDDGPLEIRIANVENERPSTRRSLLSVVSQWLGVPKKYLIVMLPTFIILGLGVMLVLILHDFDDDKGCQSRTCTWALISNDTMLQGDTGGDQFGYSVALSQDGRRLAVNAMKNVYLYSPNETMGYVRVYDEDDDGGWSLLSAPGSELSIMEEDAVGGVSMSADGTRISFLSEPDTSGDASHYNTGRPVVLEHADGTNWTVVGHLDDTARRHTNGVDASIISGDGTRIGSRRSYDTASIHQYGNAFGNEEWDNLGQDLPCASAPLLSYDGTRAVCNGPTREFDTPFFVNTFDYIENGTWVKRGGRVFWNRDVCRPLREQYHCPSTGFSTWQSGLSLTRSGDRLAASYEGFCRANCHDEDGVETEREIRTSGVAVYQWDHSLALWQSMKCSPLRDKGHHGIAISGDGTRLAVGDHRAYNDSGVVRIFEYISECWYPIGDELRGTIPRGRFGYALSLSHDGTRLAVGAPHHYYCLDDAPACKNGTAYVFELQAI